MVKAPDDGAPTDHGDPASVEVPAGGSSPYSTGGGGVSFAHRVAAVLLASMLTGARRTEGAELPVTRLSFQTGPSHPVDDLLVEYSDGTAQASAAVACRATPNFVKSHKETQKLVRTMLDEVANHESDTHRVVVATNGKQKQWSDLETLCELARSHAQTETFIASVKADRRWSRSIRNRYDQFLGIVQIVSPPAASTEDIERLTWRLLARLHVIEFAVQTPDESDRTAIATSLDALAARAKSGLEVRNLLEVESTRYDAAGAVVDLNVLRRDLHSVLESRNTRSIATRRALEELRAEALASTRDTIGDATSEGTFQIPFAERRVELAAMLKEVGTDASSALITGASGTGKSALALSVVAELEQSADGAFEAVVLNLRTLPPSRLGLRAALGIPVEQLLDELSAPSRVLVVDAADAALEGRAALLSDLALSAAAADVGLVAITADTAADFVRSQIAQGFPKDASPFVVAQLNDEEVLAVANSYPRLRSVLRAVPQVSLMRRLVVLDLLVRTGAEPDHTLGEWECLELIWSQIVRRDGLPRGGSAEAREQTLLAVAHASLYGELSPAGPTGIDPSAIDALRADHLLAPPSLYVSAPRFAHDEVRKYATAILLVRNGQPTAALAEAASPRWALSAATLACKGLLANAGVRAEAVYRRLLEEFREFSTTRGTRWAEVPIEAVLDTRLAYESLAATAASEADLEAALGDLVRVVQQRLSVDGLPDPVAAEPVIRLIIGAEQPWNTSERTFALLASWLQALVAGKTPAGHELRIALRDKMLAHWAAATPDNGVSTPDDDLEHSTSSRLPHEVTREQFVEILALIGPDLNPASVGCLLEIARRAPGHLAPAADSPFSASAIAQLDPDLLATLVEAYYIDDKHSWHHDEGVRSHQGRWIGFGLPFYSPFFGGFLPLFRSAKIVTSARVLNGILNSGAKARVARLAELDAYDFNSAPDPALVDPSRETNLVDLNLTGTATSFYGDGHTWSWYRGTTVGPYAAMSALLAMEKLLEELLNVGIKPKELLDVLMADCENLAMPGLLFGTFVRHLDMVESELDPFLAEPRVWELEFNRHVQEHSGLAASTPGLSHVDRRDWTPREVAASLVLRADEVRAAELRAIAHSLIEKGDELGIAPELTHNWAASLDKDQYRVRQVGEDLYLEVELPEELSASQRAHEAFVKAENTGLRLKNRYWGSRKHDPEYAPPTPAEIASDLREGRTLLEDGVIHLAAEPIDAVTHVARAAILEASEGRPEALGENGPFAIKLVIDQAELSGQANTSQHADTFFDLGADRAAAEALPALLTPALAEALLESGETRQRVSSAGLAMAEGSSRETQLYLARGCDRLWRSPCTDTPCIHEVALDWLQATAREAELGPWDQGTQRREQMRIDGDVAERLALLNSNDIVIGDLTAAIRGLGSAASQQHCTTARAATLLAVMLDVQARAMVSQRTEGWSVDDRGEHTLAAARSLLACAGASGEPSVVIAHLDKLSSDASLITNFLHGLAAAGAEHGDLADAAAVSWPIVAAHALQYSALNPSPYQDHSWGDWAVAALLPSPATWTQGVHNEVVGAGVDWVRAADLVELVDSWVSIAEGIPKALDALVTLMRGLPENTQAKLGIPWVARLCARQPQLIATQSWHVVSWLKEIRRAAEDSSALHEWQLVVDSLVVAGCTELAAFST